MTEKQKQFFRKNINPLLEKFPSHEGVYLITCNETNKKYVGSSTNLKQRISGYIYHPNHKKKGNKRFLTYGNFTVDLLQEEKGLSRENLLKLELHWINTLSTAYPLGLNFKCPVNNTYLNEECYKVEKPEGYSLKRDSTAYWLEGNDPENYRVEYKSSIDYNSIENRVILNGLSHKLNTSK